MSIATTTPEERWAERRLPAALVSATTVVLPLVAAIGATFLVRPFLPGPVTTIGTICFWIALVAVATLVLVVVDRQARRLLPLATLLKMSMVFPDRAPSRFRVALRAGTVRRLEERIEHAKRHGAHARDQAKAAETVLVLAGALSAHDRRTRGHSERVRALADMVADELRLWPGERDRLRWAALLHDVGKVAVHPTILNKPDSLEDREWVQIRRHPIEGARLVMPLRPWLGEWADIIEQHHERFDGAGYPHGLHGADISLGARIVAVVDAFEVMTAGRTYAGAMTAEAARQELAAAAGTQFDPLVVKAFLKVSVGRVRWAMGPLAFLAQLPFVQPAAQRLPVQPVTAGARLAVGAMVVAVASVIGTWETPPAPVTFFPVAAEVAGEQFESPEPDVPAADAEPAAPVAPPAAAPTSPTSTSTTVAPAAPRPIPAPAAVTAAPPVTVPAVAAPPLPVVADPPVNLAPVLTPDTVVTPARRPTKVDVLANDADVDGELDVRSLRIVDGPTPDGPMRANLEADGTVTLVPGSSPAGLYSLVYEVCDVRGACSRTTLTVSVL